MHVHFLPPNIQRRVWAQFDQAGPKIGREWPIRYRGSHEERVEHAARASAYAGSRRCPTPTGPGSRRYLNDWARGFAAEVPECLWSATFYPEPEAAAYVAELVADGVEVFKVHVQVGEFHLDDPLLDDGLGRARGRRHADRHPRRLRARSATRSPGPSPLRRVLERHPRLTAVVAHMGAPEYAEFLALAERYERTCLDTTMVFTDFFDAEAPYPDALLPRLADLGDKVLFGSDFPTIPYPYAHQLEALQRLRDREPGSTRTGCAPCAGTTARPSSAPPPR